MPFGVLSGIPDIITHTKFCFNRLRGFSVAAPPKVPSPILFRTTLTTVLHYRAECDICLMAVFVLNVTIVSLPLMPAAVVFSKALFLVLFFVFYATPLSTLETILFVKKTGGGFWSPLPLGSRVLKRDGPSLPAAVQVNTMPVVRKKIMRLLLITDTHCNK